MKAKRLFLQLTRLGVAVAVVFLISVAADVSPAVSAEVMLNSNGVQEFEYHWNASSGEHWYCNNYPVRLRLEVNFNGVMPVEIFRDRAGIGFDTSPIPDNAIIQSVHLLLYVKDPFTYLQPVEFKRFQQQVGSIGGAMCFGAYIQIDNGLEYAQELTQFGYNAIDLGPNAAADLQSRLAVDWFSVGLKMDFDLVWDYNDCAILSATNDPYPHKLVVNYLIKDGEPLPSSFDQDDENTTWGKVKALYQ